MRDYKELVLPILLKHFPSATIYLFGSRATGKAREGSDIDIAIQETGKIPFDRMADARIELEASTLPIKYDLVDMALMPDAMKADVLREGILWKS